LHAQGVALNVPNHFGNEPLHFACGEGLLETVQWIHAQGVALNPMNDNGNQPVDFASAHPEVVKWMQAQGVKINKRANSKCMALHLMHHAPKACSGEI